MEQAKYGKTLSPIVFYKIKMRA